jgi:hypothetical protein
VRAVGNLIKVKASTEPTAVDVERRAQEKIGWTAASATEEPRQAGLSCERTTGIEPATLSLGS